MIMSCERCGKTIRRRQRYIITFTPGVWNHRTRHRDEMDCNLGMPNPNAIPELDLKLRPGPPEAA
jgi:hypothetical protein